MPSDRAAALVLVDVLNGFFHPDGAMWYEGVERVVPALRRLLSAARGSGALVVHAADRHRPDVVDREFSVIPEHLHRGGFDAEFYAGFEPIGVGAGRREAPLLGVLRHRPRPLAPRARDRDDRRRRRQDQRVHPGDGDRRVRPRVHGRHPAGGDELQPSPPRGGVGRGHGRGTSPGSCRSTRRWRCCDRRRSATPASTGRCASTACRRPA